MFVFDIETLSKQSNAVILSMGAVYFDPSEKPSPEKLREDGFFVKCAVKHQIADLKRSTQKSTMEWWSKQCDIVKKASFIPSRDEYSIEDSLEAMRQWAKQYDDGKCWVWARGSLDEIVLDDVCEQLEIEPVWTYNRWRDVRTAVDIFYTTTNGYCEIDYPGFNRDTIMKHHPLDDCVLDAMMLLYGKDKCETSKD